MSAVARWDCCYSPLQLPHLLQALGLSMMILLLLRVVLARSSLVLFQAASQSDLLFRLAVLGIGYLAGCCHNRLA
jgi:hypothetical protein